jgi:hypothetical protein
MINTRSHSHPYCGKAFQARLLKTGREPTNGLSGKGQPLTRLKPSKVQRKPIPGSTWSGCAFATRGILTCGRTPHSTLQSPPSLESAKALAGDLATGDACRIQPVETCAPGHSTISHALKVPVWWLLCMLADAPNSSIEFP